MKKYIRNENFIPKKFYDLKIQKEEEYINKIKFLFIILNLILLPMTLKNIYVCKENKSNLASNAEISEIKVEESNINVDDIVTWINNIFLEEVESACVDKYGGEFKINKIESLQKISNDINIKNINNDNTNYILGVELNNERK
ncbi:hypothetical protein [uncultured Clostridium sp.]|uniref:hypothetical protein n=1 Tax=uncultured Clostridium sp. TaxID=59620 RepID=UPI0028E9F4EC|nr:hypothetical protein [uncultured Clostridium sp.]